VAIWRSSPFTASIASTVASSPGRCASAAELQQLQIAGDRPVDVDGGVEARLGELAAGLPGCLQDLLTQHAVGRVQALGRAEELLLVASSSRRRRQRRRRARTGGPRRRRRARPGRARARRARAADALGALAALEAETKTWSNSIPFAAPRASARHAPGAGGSLAGRLDAGLGDRAEVADEVAGRAVRLAPRPGGGQLGQPREAEQPLGDLGLGGEEALAAQPTRSIRRRTKTSARRSSIAAEARRRA
jgi:hypothetical protein